MTGTPLVSSVSSVAGMSRSDLAPAQTTHTAERAISPRSAETSRVSAQPRWTPPIPPVAMKWMPAIVHTAMVPPTVVAPEAPETAHVARSRGPTLRMSGPVASRSRSASSRPTRTAPSITATVAGTAPAPRTRASHSRATSTPMSAGSPWATIDVSSATTGSERMSARSISAVICRRPDGCLVIGRPAYGRRCYTRRSVQRRYRSRRAGHLRQPPQGGDRRSLFQLREADLPGLHGAGAGRHQVPRVRPHASLGPGHAAAAEGGAGDPDRLRGRLGARGGARLRRRHRPRVLHDHRRDRRRHPHRPRHAARRRLLPLRGDGLDRRRRGGLGVRLRRDRDRGVGGRERALVHPGAGPADRRILRLPRSVVSVARTRRRGVLRSFLVGGVVGAAAGVLAGPRLRRGRPRPDGRRVAGLKAFEGAPCWHYDRGEDDTADQWQAPWGGKSWTCDESRAVAKGPWRGG